MSTTLCKVAYKFSNVDLAKWVFKSEMLYQTGKSIFVYPQALIITLVNTQTKSGMMVQNSSLNHNASQIMGAKNIL